MQQDQRLSGHNQGFNMRLLRQTTALAAGLLMSVSVIAADNYNSYQEEKPGYLAMICGQPAVLCCRWQYR